jgi:2-dehydro-3-deoxyphosphogluconate aldolase/(4S)-4-hydroxy-2-oxoglutarate aldolase
VQKRVTGPVDSAQEVAEHLLERLGVLPVVELTSLSKAEPLINALSTAGLPAMEVTLRTSAGLAALGTLRESHPEALIGAGTVRSVEDAQRAVEAGAQFVVAPVTNPGVMDFCFARGVLMIPGACTPTEVDLAKRAGAKLIKFFPAEAIGGVPFLEALAGPFKDVRFVPTGGINASNLANYLRRPEVIACGGSWLVTPTLQVEGRFDRVEELAREALRIVAGVRSE